MTTIDQPARSGRRHRLPGGSILGQAARLAGSVVLWTLAGLGLVCIVVAIAAFAFGLHLTLFSTGSMAPTIPQGAVALTKDTPAAKLKVGDVVTVYRAKELPITHRIVSIDAVPGRPAERSIVMKGDANKVADTTPYVISHGGKVLYSVRGGARWVTRIDDPRVLAGTSLVAAVIVGWVFWPRRSESDLD